MKQDKTEKVAAEEKKEISANAGTVKVHENVLTSITRRAVSEIPGFIRFAGNTIVDNLAEIVGTKKLLDRAIAVETFEENSSVKIDIRVVLAYGFHVPTVCAAIQKSIVENITTVTGMTIDSVNVFVMDLEDIPTEEENIKTDMPVTTPIPMI